MNVMFAMLLLAHDLNITNNTEISVEFLYVSKCQISDTV